MTTLVKNPNRQDELVAHKEVLFSDLVDDTYLAVVDVPENAIVTGGFLAITTLFDSATTDQFSIGDKDGSAAAVKTTYAAKSADVTAAGTIVPLVPTGKKYASRSSVGVVWDGTGTAPTAGKALLVVKYILDKRAHSTEG